MSTLWFILDWSLSDESECLSQSSKYPIWLQANEGAVVTQEKSIRAFVCQTYTLRFLYVK